MINNLDPASELFLSNVDRIQERLAKANLQAASGKRVVHASDAPDQIDSILQLRADRQHNQQIQSNLAMARTDVQTADAALTAAIKLMDRARVLASQAASTVLDADSRKSLAGEADALLDQMLQTSQTAVQGRFVFSGDQDDKPSYVLNTASPTGVTRLLTAPSTRRIESPTGGSFASGKTAQEIFDSRNADDTVAADNVFAALNSLRAALVAGDSAASAAAVNAVKAASVRLNSMQTQYGTIQGRIEDAASFADKYDTDLRVQLGQKEDADVAAAALEVTQGGTQLQAAFQMRAMLPRRSLFEFLG